MVLYAGVVFLFAYVAFASLFIGKYIIYTVYLAKALKVDSAFNEVVRPVGSLYSLFNAYRQYIYDPTVKMSKVPVIEFFVSNAMKNMEYLQHIENFKHILLGIIDSTQYNEIDSLMLNNVCPKVDYFATVEDCEKFSDGLTKQGLIYLISGYQSEIMNMLRDYELTDKSTEEYINDKRLFESCTCLLYTSPSPRDSCASRMPSSACKKKKKKKKKI
eukprot:TRINITY_DN4954_c0_g1_i5.p1 TRINITY_DN4954_c0_g1~~TRINITY_DN4954_c0_g1_i5.p1  ORF type:complete len:216 (-),score=37.63 TRINITY_DN4954_c0_g1_i5:15-662(-)